VGGGFSLVDVARRLAGDEKSKVAGSGARFAGLCGGGVVGVSNRFLRASQMS